MSGGKTALSQSAAVRRANGTCRIDRAIRPAAHWRIEHSPLDPADGHRAAYQALLQNVTESHPPRDGREHRRNHQRADDEVFS